MERHRIQTMAVMGLVALLAACTSSPPHGTGGVAELQTLPLKPAPYGTRWTPGLIADINALQIELNQAQVYLGTLQAVGADRCFPAQWQANQLLSARIAREMQAGLYIDAANDLVRLTAAMNELHHRMDYIAASVSCIPLAPPVRIQPRTNPE